MSLLYIVFAHYYPEEVGHNVRGICVLLYIIPADSVG